MDWTLDIAQGDELFDLSAEQKVQLTLLAARDLGLFDKNEKSTLEENLNLRNRSGHPGQVSTWGQKGLELY